jgi:biotin transport system substrate-specific component
MVVTVLDKYRDVRYNLFKWRCEASLIHKIILAFAMASFTGIAAQVRIPLPWTPVPISAQTFAVLLSGVLLGGWYGGLSQVFYIGAGIAGVPWFSGGGSGIAYISGPTGGYMIGFILAALFIGYFVDRFVRARGFFAILVLMFFANFVLIHLPGLLQLSVVTGVRNIYKLLSMGTLPFIVGDVAKVLAAAALAKAITPEQAYNGEVDVGFSNKQ